MGTRGGGVESGNGQAAQTGLVLIDVKRWVLHLILDQREKSQLLNAKRKEDVEGSVISTRIINDGILTN